MNLLQTFMAAAAEQAQEIVEEEFTIAGDATVYLGTFGSPQMMGIMTRQGYQDHLVTPMNARATQWPTTPPTTRVELVRTQTGRTLFIQLLNPTDPVFYQFVLTDRQL